MGYADPTLMDTTKLDTSIPGFGGGAPTQSPGFGASTPELPGLAGMATTGATPGMSGYTWASILGMLSKALAPVQYKWGKPMNSPIANLGEGIQQMSQAQLMAKALAAPQDSNGSGGSISPQMLMMLMGNNPMMARPSGGA